MSGAGARPGGARGFVTVQFVAAVALSLVLFTALANLLVWSYARGVVRAALDEGARAGARAADSTVECRARAEAVLGDLLGGAMGAEVGPVSCTDTGALIEAAAAARLRGWLPAVPDWSFSAEAVAVREPPP